MAGKITDLYAATPINIGPDDLIEVVQDTGTSPESGAAKLAQLMFNRYKFSVTVSSNDLVVALVHENGDAPSTNKPLYFKIGNSLRIVSAALTLTIADGTNWFNLGAPEFGTIEQDLFIYVSWRTASSAVVLGASRIPYALVYSDFSGTTTNETHGEFSTAPASTDDCVVIGRIAATLSLAATSHLWTSTSQSAPTSKNTIPYPIYSTRSLSWSPTWTNLTTTSATITAKYLIEMRVLRYHIEVVWGASTSIGGDVSHTAPMTWAGYGAAGSMPMGLLRMLDASAGAAFAGIVQFTIASTSIVLRAQNIVSTYLAAAALSSTVPFTWTTSDTISEQGWYFLV